MSYGITLHAVDLDWQITLLEFEPQIANKHLQPAMTRAVHAVKTAIGSRMTFRDRTGEARSTLMSKVSGQGMRIKGRVGWWGDGMPWHVNVLEYGTAPHFIGFVPALGVTVDHPGLPAMKFVEGGAAEASPEVLVEMEIAAVNITNDLAVKG